MSAVLPDAERAQRERESRRQWEEKRIERLRADLAPMLGRTIWLDLANAVDQLAPRLLARVVDVRGDEIEVTDMGDATIPPNEKPRQTIGFGQIRDWRQA